MRLANTTSIFPLVVNDLESGSVSCIVDNMDWELGRVTLIALLG